MVSRNGKVDAAPNPLLPRVAQGDPGAVRECIDRYGALVWSIVRKSLRDHSQAEDVVQEIYISLWEASHRFDPTMGSETVFVSTIARRRLIDRYRRGQRGPETEPLEEPVPVERDAGLARVELDDETERAFAALRQLKPEQRRLLEMWSVGGMTHSEIATSTGVPLGTVKSQIRRGLLRVREMLRGHPLASSGEASA